MNGLGSKADQCVLELSFKWNIEAERTAGIFFGLENGFLRNGTNKVSKVEFALETVQIKGSSERARWQ